MISEAARNRIPRPILENSVALGALLEGAEPPLGLAEGEVQMIVGRPPSFVGQTDEGAPIVGDDGQRCWDGMLSYARNEHLVYRRDDGRVLRYEYEGALAYALAEDAAA